MAGKDPEGLVADLEPRGMVYVGGHQTSLFTKYMYISCGPYDYGIDDFLSYQMISLHVCNLLIPMWMTSFQPRGLIGRTYVGGSWF